MNPGDVVELRIGLNVGGFFGTYRKRGTRAVVQGITEGGTIILSFASGENAGVHRDGEYVTHWPIDLWSQLYD